MIELLQDKFALSEQGAKNLIKGIMYSVLVNISLMVPVALLALVINSFMSLITKEEKIVNWGIPTYIFTGVIILAVIFIFHYFQYSATYIRTYDESKRRRISIGEKIRTLPLAFFGERNTADLTGIIMSDCASFEHAFSHSVPQFFGAVISTIIVCVNLLCVNFKMGLALLWVAPISFAIVLLSRKLQNKLGSKHIADRNKLAEGIQECLETVSVIKSCNREREYLEKLDKKMDESEKSQILSEMTTASLITTGQMFLRLGLATVIVVGNSMVLKNETDLFTYILFLIAASRIFDPLSGAMSNMVELFNIGLQIDRIKQIVNYKVQSGSNEFKKGNYDITFKNVEFSYEKGKSVLEDVSFTAKMGEVTALVGPSGGGKSTIAKLAARFHDLNGGQIFLGENDISKIAPEVLLENFSFVFQDVILFNNTIMENIRIGRQSASDEEVIEAAKAARCAEFIQELPDGYNTIVGENGSTLSGGECQRLSIARALLKDAPVILLDEATASLDVDSETKVQSAISRLIKGKTVLVIAHRMRTIEASDKIVVLSDGKVAEEGTHHTLIRKKGIYNRMVNLQMSSDSWKLKS
jgi:ATP-binding cassette, subfamily B, bacterial IrtB/YbtQ